MLGKYLVKSIKAGPKFYLNRGFSTKARTELISLFQKEIEYEQKEYKPISKEEKTAFFQNTGFSLIDDSKNTKLELKKSLNNYDVSIIYYARPPLPQNEESENNEEPSNFANIFILVQKSKELSGYLIDAAVIDSEIQFNSFTASENVPELYKSMVSNDFDQDKYQGPDFSTLDDNLQEEFRNFVELELTIDSEVTTFIEITSLDKEQSQYLKWLKEAKNILV